MANVLLRHWTNYFLISNNWQASYIYLQAVHVGDTIADIGMGRRANLGATVGVLSGVGGVDDLDPAGADHIVPSIKHILSIALK